MATSDYLAPGMTLAEIENAVAQMRYKAASYAAASAAQATQIDLALTNAAQAAATWEGRGFWWSKKRGNFSTIATVSVVSVARVTGTSIATIVATAHGLTAGSRVRINGCTTAGFDTDDSQVLTTADANTFTYTNAGATVTTTADATGTITCHSFPLRTIGGGTMVDMSSPTSVYVDDDYPLGKMDKTEFDDWLALYPTGGGGQPMQYCIWEDTSSILATGLMIGFIPIPTAVHQIKIPYVRRHSKILGTGATTSTDTALIVPSEYHREIYVEGALFLLRSEKINNTDLTQCAPYMRAIRAMAAQDPSRFGDSRSGVSVDPTIRTWVRGNGDIIPNVGSVSA